MGAFNNMFGAIGNMSSERAKQISADVMAMVKQNMAGYKDALGLQQGDKLQSLQAKQLAFEQDPNNWKNDLSSRLTESQIAENMRAANAPYGGGGGGGSDDGLTPYQLMQLAQGGKDDARGYADKMLESEMADYANNRVGKPSNKASGENWTQSDIWDAYYRQALKQGY